MKVTVTLEVEVDVHEGTISIESMDDVLEVVPTCRNGMWGMPRVSLRELSQVVDVKGSFPTALDRLAPALKDEVPF